MFDPMTIIRGIVFALFPTLIASLLALPVEAIQLITNYIINGSISFVDGVWVLCASVSIGGFSFYDSVGEIVQWLAPAIGVADNLFDWPLLMAGMGGLAVWNAIFAIADAIAQGVLQLKATLFRTAISLLTVGLVRL